jgi:hypothetical protein
LRGQKTLCKKFSKNIILSPTLPGANIPVSAFYLRTASIFILTRGAQGHTFPPESAKAASVAVKRTLPRAVPESGLRAFCTCFLGRWILLAKIYRRFFGTMFA